MNKNIEKKTTKESYDGGKKSTGYFVQFESDLPIESSDQDAFGMNRCRNLLRSAELL